MTADERVQAIADFGFTERQARFLALVKRHAGVCVPRQYASFAGIANGGRKCNAFFDTLTRRGYAVATRCIHNRGRLYHVRHKRLYRAIGEPESRYRRPVPAARAVRRVMLLDVVLTCPDVEWFTTTQERATYRASLTPSPTDPDTMQTALPTKSTRSSRDPDELQLGLDSSGRLLVQFLVTVPWTDDLRRVLRVHAEMLAAARSWTVRLVFPRPLDRVLDAYRTAARKALVSLLDPDTPDRWIECVVLPYTYRHLAPLVAHDPGPPPTAVDTPPRSLQPAAG